MKKTKTTKSELRKHSMWTDSDYAYFKSKGYTNDEILSFWNRDETDGKSPVHHKYLTFSIVDFLYNN